MNLPKPGTSYDAAIVRRVDANVGVLLELPPSGAAAAPTDDESRMGKQSYSPPKGACLGYVHISDATDDHIERLEKKFKVGATVRSRVIGRRVVDGVATASCKIGRAHV